MTSQTMNIEKSKMKWKQEMGENHLFIRAFRHLLFWISNDYVLFSRSWKMYFYIFSCLFSGVSWREMSAILKKKKYLPISVPSIWIQLGKINQNTQWWMGLWQTEVACIVSNGVTLISGVKSPDLLKQHDTRFNWCVRQMTNTKQVTLTTPA